jgi:outer membrane protein assembly factor BamD
MQLNLKKTNLFLALLLFVAMSGTAMAQTNTSGGKSSDEKASDTTKTADKKADTSKKPAKAAAKTSKKKADEVSGSAEPDKVLYNRAMLDYKRGKYTEERLSLQTLINTYPDSEYLAKAKLGTGDSYYKEGGVSNLTQSIAEYKDFITFFPFLDESAYAQMQVGMAHYRMMEKADRDTSQAQAAEQEFQTFLEKYPNNPLVPKAQQRLRNVQEVLADGEFRIATFYYLKGVRSYRAALARLNEVIERYPLYSQADRALWMAGGIYDKAERRETADQLYARIVREYPSSKYAPDAKRKLAEAGVPIPNADEKAVALVAANKSGGQGAKANVMQRSTGLIRSGPDFSKAARAGDPNLTAPDDNQSATDVLRPGATGPSFSAGGGGNQIAVQAVTPSSDAGTGTGTGSGDDARPATIQPGTTAAPVPTDNAPVAAPSSGDSGSLPAPMSPDNGAPDAGAAGGGTAVPAGGVAPESAPAESPARPIVDSKEDTTTASDAEAAKVVKGGAEAAGGAPAASSSAPATSAPAAAAPAATAPGSTAPGSADPNGAPAKATSSESASQKSQKPDPGTESSSKKKKGIKKVIPW